MKIIKKIDRIKFMLLSDNNINDLALTEIKYKTIHDIETRKPFSGGPLDLKLGVSTTEAKCETCNQGLQDCPGHWGKINLVLPVFHIALFKEIINILNSICKKCSSLLIKNKHDIKSKINIVDQCKKIKQCYNCNSFNGIVKKSNGFRIFHEFHKFNSKSKDVEDNKLFCDELNPLTVYNLFKNIKETDLLFLSCKNPCNLLIKTLLVPPCCIRPSVDMDQDGFNEDDLTVKLSEIINCNNLIEENIKKGTSLITLNEDWDYLQLQIALYINSDLPSIHINNNDNIKSIIHRLKGKQGRFRMNLSGKRVDFSGRTVISPNPNLSIEQIGVPKEIALEMTIPEKVTNFNKEELQILVNNGPNCIDGANYIIRSEVRNNEMKTFKIFLKFAKNPKIKELKVGDIVERHIKDGDIVLFNRQPSLHRMSIMAHRVKLHDNRTFQFNESVCNPYNADFDGDEMNIHLPQTKAAQAEAIELMSIKKNICTVKNNEPLISPTQDFITGMYLLTNKNRILTKNEFYKLIGHIHCGKRIIIEPSIIIYKSTTTIKLFTGKQIVDYMLCNVTINLKTKNRNKEDVIIKNSRLIRGTIDKSIIGAENRNSSLIYQFFKQNKAECIRFINNISKVSIRYIMEYGFSIGLDDIYLSNDLNKSKNKLVLNIINTINKECNDGTDRSELKKTSLLNKIREDCGTMCLNTLNKSNAAVVMAECGSKGSKINISQMITCVGQQIVSGMRIQNGMYDKTIPHMKNMPNTLDDIIHRGFVYNSFFTGLKAYEFFFHAISGREGLVDTAVKTADTGYMQRRLMKALENLSIKYDNTVRNNNNEIIQFLYGEDGKDPLYDEMIDNSIKKIIEPGTAVGAIAAQSIGEPGTQMTLKTFHFAGVASMNITLGVPRIKEIINATSTISTPIISVKNVNLKNAYIIKQKLEKCTFKDIIKKIDILYTHEKNIFNMIFTCIYPLSNNILEKLCVKPLSSKYNTMNLFNDNNYSYYQYKFKYNGFNIFKIKNTLLTTQISGLTNTNKVFIKETNKDYELLISSSFGDLPYVLGTEFINPYTTITNNILEIESTLGIEAAREAIINEIEYTIGTHGIQINCRHLMLLADTMTIKGHVLGITRFGMKYFNSTLMLASFEQTSDFLFQAAIEEKEDIVSGVSDSIILGKNISIGTGDNIQLIDEI